MSTPESRPAGDRRPAPGIQPSAFSMLVEAVPDLEHLSPTFAAAVERDVQVARVAAGTVLFDEGTPCTRFLVLHSGVVRVSQMSPGGRELLLYHVRPGDGCILTIVCLLGHAEYAARGVAETDLFGVLMPGQLFEDLISGVPAFRRFVFTRFAGRVKELVGLVSDVSFARLDQRLAQSLVRRARHDGSPTLRTTHRELAEELGSVREIISRLLEGFEVRGTVRMSRGEIELRDLPALESIAAGGPVDGDLPERKRRG